jgi:hypothetical protein
MSSHWLSTGFGEIYENRKVGSAIILQGETHGNASESSDELHVVIRVSLEKRPMYGTGVAYP